MQIWLEEICETNGDLSEKSDTFKLISCAQTFHYWWTAGNLAMYLAKNTHFKAVQNKFSFNYCVAVAIVILLTILISAFYS